MSAPTIDPRTGGLSLTLGSLLDEPTRKAVADLNRHYLRLCLEPRAEPDRRFELAEALGARFGRLDAEVLDRVAACPFTLFDVRLQHAIAGAACAASTAESRVGEGLMGYPLGAVDTRMPLFAHQVLFFAWHLAQTAPMTCRLAMGFSPVNELAMREISPTRLTELCLSPELIRPRWQYNLRFWTLLLSAAVSASDPQLHRGHCLGMQLLAFDLQGAPDTPVPPRRCR